MNLKPPTSWEQAGNRLEGELHLRIQKQIVPGLREWQVFMDRLACQSIRAVFRLPAMASAEKFLRAAGVQRTEVDHWILEMVAERLVTLEPIPMVRTAELLPWLLKRQWYGVFDAPSVFDELRARWQEIATTIGGLAHRDEQPLIGLSRIDAHRAPSVEWAGRTGGTFAEIAISLAEDLTDVVLPRGGESTWDTLHRVVIRDVTMLDHLKFDTLDENLLAEQRKMEVRMFNKNKPPDAFTPEERRVGEWAKVFRVSVKTFWNRREAGTIRVEKGSSATLLRVHRDDLKRHAPHYKPTDSDDR